MRISDKVKEKKISLEDIEKIYKTKSYDELYKLVNKLIDNMEIIPIKSGGGNGKSPALYSRYKILSNEEDNSQYLEELNFKLNNNFDISYYKNNIDKYKKHRKYIIELSDFLMKNKEMLKVPVSMNERSFQIWKREKFLQKEEGKTILKNLGLEEEILNYYNTSEPLAYYSRDKKVPQNVLIVENKDTFYTIRKFLINSNESIFKTDISTVIYGGGKGLVKAFKDYPISVEEYVSDKKNQIYYFGDMDYEGIVIYESLYSLYKDQYKISPFIEGYEKIMDKAKDYLEALPHTKEGQNKNLKGEFFKCFTSEYVSSMNKVLASGLYIPQEIINISDLMEEV